jgi:hypothetical protein
VTADRLAIAAGARPARSTGTEAVPRRDRSAGGQCGLAVPGRLVRCPPLHPSDAGHLGDGQPAHSEQEQRLGLRPGQRRDLVEPGQR